MIHLFAVIKISTYVMLQNKSGYRTYSVRAYTDIRKLREGFHLLYTLNER